MVIGTIDDPQVKRQFLVSDLIVSKLAAVENDHIIEMTAQGRHHPHRHGSEILADALKSSAAQMRSGIVQGHRGLTKLLAAEAKDMFSETQLAETSHQAP
jgi:hypothetical protein